MTPQEKGYSNLRYQLQKLKDQLALRKWQGTLNNPDEPLIIDNPDLLHATPRDPKMTKIYSAIFKSVGAGHSVDCGCWCVQGTPARTMEEIRKYTHYVDKNSLVEGHRGGWSLFLCGWPLSGSMATIVWKSVTLTGKMENFATCPLCLEAEKLGGVPVKI
jgi:hypothetical protein